MTFSRGGFHGDAPAFDWRTIHLLILRYQTFTSRSLNAKMKASTPDKCTRGLSTLLYFCSAPLMHIIRSRLLFSRPKCFQALFFKNYGALRESRASIPCLHFHSLVVARDSPPSVVECRSSTLTSVIFPRNPRGICALRKTAAKNETLGLH